MDEAAITKDSLVVRKQSKENAPFLKVEIFTQFLYAKKTKNAALLSRAECVKKTTIWCIAATGQEQTLGNSSYKAQSGAILRFERSETKSSHCLGL